MRGRCARSVVALALAPAGALASPAAFDAQLTLELAGGAPVAVASASGQLDAAGDGTLVFPELSLPLAVGVTLLPSAPACITGLSVVPARLGPGTLAPRATGFGGRLPLSADLRVALDPTLGVSPASLSFGVGAPGAVTGMASSLSPSVALPLSLSVSPWTRAPVTLTATQAGQPTSTWTASGFVAATFEGGVTQLVVSPVHLFHPASFELGTQMRTLPLVARLTLTVPSPARTTQGLVAIAVLLVVGLRRRVGSPPPREGA